ncbi:hypothetical protein GCM10023091_21800 [Ravibacter arvi]|uniref:Dienelactone hydrolase domain-containing protein n=1 Tax=Ravibacter arvi TaxID=2051041 RepID=A0ABP8LYM7_9BACT
MIRCAIRLFNPLAALFVCVAIVPVAAFQGPFNPESILSGTAPLTFEGDLSSKLLEEAHADIERRIAEAPAKRAQFWNRDFSGAAAYNASIAPNRERLRRYLGVEDRSRPAVNYNQGLPDKYPQVGMEIFSTANEPALVAETEKYEVYQVRWPVLERVSGEGLLIRPKGKPVANVVVVPDADQTPEQMIGLAPGIALSSQIARKLAENGIQVLIPTLIDRGLLFPGQAKQQSRREWLYRQAFHMGKHLIGYEVQKVMAAIDWFEKAYSNDVKVGVAGYLEGGLIALYTAALDTRVDATLVSGYFQSRQNIWREPIYRNVWGILEEFGDAEIASMVAPRALAIEYSSIPEIWDGSRADSLMVYRHTGFKGKLQTPVPAEVQQEYQRLNTLVKSGFQKRKLFTGDKGNPVAFGSDAAVSGFAGWVGASRWKSGNDGAPAEKRSSFDPAERQFRQAKEIDEHVQNLLRISDYQRNEFFLYQAVPDLKKRTWSTKTYHPYLSPDGFAEKGNSFRQIFANDIIGRFPDKLTDPAPRSRKVYDMARWTGHEVLLNVFGDFSAAGVILIPKDLKEDEKRPVVVTQHGRNGVPGDVIAGNTSYNNIAGLLADQGFIVFVPYGLYRGEDRYRWLCRKANTVRKTLFSYALAQHEQILNWLNTLPQVDGKRIAFYGKSYGGEMAMRIPSILEGYSLSVCSGDFGDWSRKVADTRFGYGFMNSMEWEMPYFNMGSTFSYAEMAYLIFPRPFMVERGRQDLVQPDEWVAYEYEKVRYLYDVFGQKDKTDIEFFNGGHASKNDGVFRFLRKHLNWP